MTWDDLKPGDVVVSTFPGDTAAFLTLGTGPSGSMPRDTELTLLCLTTSRVGKHTQTGMVKLSRHYTVLRGHDVVQRGSHD